MVTSLPDEFLGVQPAVFDGVAHFNRIRDGILVSSQGRFDLRDPACQATQPTCPPGATYAGMYNPVALSHAHVFDVQPPSTTKGLVWYPGVKSPCPGVPATCNPEAQATLTVFGGASVGGDVVYAPSATGIDAFAENGVTNCTTATPRVCSPLAHFNLGGVPTGELQITNGRVYVNRGNEIHVLSPPARSPKTGAARHEATALR